MVKKKKIEVGTPEDNKLIQHSADKIKQTVDGLGGTEEAQRRLELSSSIFYYHTLARKAGIDVQNFDKTIEYILQLFRDAIATKGYKGLQRNMIPVVYYYGTIKDKAGLCLQYFDYFRSVKDGKHPPIGKRTIDSLRRKIADTGTNNLKEFVSYLGIYEAYKKVSRHFYFVEGIYFSTIYQTALYIQNYEWITRTAEIFTAMLPFVPKTADSVTEEDIKGLTNIIEKQNEYLQSNHLYGKLKVINGEKVEDKEAFSCLEFATGMAERVTPVLSNLKGIIEGIKEWTKEREGNPYKSILMPQELRSVITVPEVSLTINEVQDKYYKSNLKAMEENGETITDYDKRIAILPSYSDVDADGEMKQQTKDKLNEALRKE